MKRNCTRAHPTLRLAAPYRSRLCVVNSRTSIVSAPNTNVAAYILNADSPDVGEEPESSTVSS